MVFVLSDYILTVFKEHLTKSITPGTPHGISVTYELYRLLIADMCT